MSHLSPLLPNREVLLFEGVTYYRYPNAKRTSDRVYFRSGNGYLHRAVWEHHHGEIPPGHEVHHRDEDPANNAISNLELSAKSHHLHHHNPKGVCSDEQRAHLARIRPKTAEWHGSAEGRRWHSQHARAVWKRLEPRDYVCEQCSAPFKSAKFGNVRFCSGACKTAWRRANCEQDSRPATCAHCAADFRASKYLKARYCSLSCASAARHHRNRESGKVLPPTVERTCQMCDTGYVTRRRTPAECCSRACGQRLRKSRREGLQPGGG